MDLPTMAHSDTAIILVLTTVPGNLDVDELVRPLVEERLAACVNVLPPMRSIYRWEGVVETADERQVLIKTTRRRLAEVQSSLSARHPYEVPEFLVIPITDGGAAYLQWVRAETA
jgi:periplasmic divalent cation tolerance protein